MGLYNRCGRSSRVSARHLASADMTGKTWRTVTTGHLCYCSFPKLCLNSQTKSTLLWPQQRYFFLFCFFYKGLQIYFCIFHYKLKFCYFSPASPFPTLVLAKLRAVFVDFGFNDQWGYKTKDLKCFLLLNSSAEIIKIWIVRVAYSQHWLAKTIKVACVMLHCCIVGIIKLIHSFRLCK